MAAKDKARKNQEPEDRKQKPEAVKGKPEEAERKRGTTPEFLSYVPRVGLKPAYNLYQIFSGGIELRTKSFQKVF